MVEIIFLGTGNAFCPSGNQLKLKCLDRKRLKKVVKPEYKNMALQKELRISVFLEVNIFV